ncbi:MAG: hypothetical protein GY884_02235 [Proteobacteria bacterium]|nr:hypothetical protein [Pseudomonadota bacterium]
MAVVLAAVALCALVFGRVLLDPFGVFTGEDGVDAWGTQWFYWLVGRRVLAGEPFAHTDLLFHPWGKAVYEHTGGNVLDALVALPTRYALGPVAGYNAFVALVLASNVGAAWLLCRDLGFRSGAALLGGLVASFNPTVLGELEGGRPTQALLAFALLAIRELIRTRTVKGFGPSLRGAFLLALAGLTYWFSAIFVVLVLTPWILADLVESRSGRHAARVVGVLVGALVLVLPLAWPMLTGLGEGAVGGLLDVELWTATTWSPLTVEGWAIGVEAVQLPTGQLVVHRLVDGELVATPIRRAIAWMELPLLGAGLLLAPPRLRLRLAVTLGVAVVLMTGPELAFGVTDPIYVGMSKVLSPLQRLWWPARAAFLGHLVVGIAAAAAWHRVPAAFRLPGVVAVIALISAELAVARLVPLSATPAEVPSLYRCLAGREGPLLEVPLVGVPERLHWQAVHERPVFGGMIDDNPVFAPAEHTAFRLENGFVRALDDLGSGRPARPVDAADVDAVRALGFEWIIVDLEPIEGGDRAHRALRQYLAGVAGEPAYDDGRMLAYSLEGSGLSCP